MTQRKPPTLRPAAFMCIYLRMAEKAREMGYTLALHGSLARDLDVVAVPWVEEAVPASELIQAFIELTGGFVINREDTDPQDYTQRNPEPKPHGRFAWSIHLGGGPYIDISVMPCKKARKKRKP